MTPSFRKPYRYRGFCTTKVRGKGEGPIRTSFWDLIFGELYLVPFTFEEYSLRNKKTIQEFYKDDPHAYGCLILEYGDRKAIVIVVRR